MPLGQAVRAAAGRIAMNGWVWMKPRTAASSRRSPQPRIALIRRIRRGCSRRNPTFRPHSALLAWESGRSRPMTPLSSRLQRPAVAVIDPCGLVNCTPIARLSSRRAQPLGCQRRGELLRVRSPRQAGSRAKGQVAIAAVVSAISRDSPRLSTLPAAAWARLRLQGPGAAQHRACPDWAHGRSVKWVLPSICNMRPAVRGRVSPRPGGGSCARCGHHPGRRCLGPADLPAAGRPPGQCLHFAPDRDLGGHRCAADRPVSQQRPWAPADLRRPWRQPGARGHLRCGSGWTTARPGRGAAG